MIEASTEIKEIGCRYVRIGGKFYKVIGFSRNKKRVMKDRIRVKRIFEYQYREKKWAKSNGDSMLLFWPINDKFGRLDVELYDEKPEEIPSPARIVLS